MTVLVDGHEGRSALARSAADAPEIDGVVRVAAGARLAVGEFARVTITGASRHDLRGEDRRLNGNWGQASRGRDDPPGEPRCRQSVPAQIRADGPFKSPQPVVRRHESE